MRALRNLILVGVLAAAAQAFGQFQITPRPGGFAYTPGVKW